MSCWFGSVVSFCAFLRNRRVGRDVGAIRMQIVDVDRDAHTVGVVPWAAADPIARVDRAFAVQVRDAQIGAPRLVAAARVLRERLAVRIRAFDAAKVAALAQTNARHEERHLRLLRLQCRGDARRK